ncbi:serine/threonine protein kinase [Ophidiomyces ophidiicola]|uniref:Serine/threonine protein kinase n=1 Tax=Ophidiomyces ophidiicola TaxID=1387563 RepID=A0ACB8UMR2_9EURO|nr:serine/threonine protein kinase [Ophidiomyces ophidiicola]KAI1905573.1 serine/threonine protein kinase [Ophidiomyces ophidiicola]KAI1911585.1 serine/threonine protein kinase [Ophidiomyces ophidiicola]KAI1924598.1 serine/threonine protein kinase [Ophidiomyces ophidiicola]KAI1940962.1 serine/threonine protein kinase [Ophidiomyces ophidiicola]KAI1946054.1 serine/threonine protein kinase [Ophidiomyces ophidiicola]
MPPRAEKSLKRAKLGAGTREQDAKKPRRSERISSQLTRPQVAPANMPYLPSPLTFQEPIVSGNNKDVTASPPEGRLSQLRHQTPKPEHVTQLSSPPGDTQAFSQVPPQAFVAGVKDEEAEGIWGYLNPLNNTYDHTVVLKKRDICTPSELDEEISRGRRKGKERIAAQNVNPSGYLIGRHAECDVVMSHTTISNRHCLIFHEHRRGDSVAILEDLSSNGTFVKGALVGRNQRRELEDGDEINILDQARFSFHYARNREIGRFQQQFRILSQLGKGQFATVYLCAEKATGTKYAAKRFDKKPGGYSESDLASRNQEVAILKSVNHKNLLCLKDIFDEKDGVYLILELAPEGELFNWIVSHEKLSEFETRHVFRQLFDGLKYLHDRNIVHRDIKSENILLMDKRLTVKLADFGLAKIIGEDSFTTTVCGTPSYVAPEVLDMKHSRAVDIWSLGVVLYICLCGFPPFSDELYSRDFPYSLVEQIKLGTFNYPSPYWDSVSDPALDLIDRMLTVSVDDRTTIDECLRHPWLTGGGIGLTDSTDGLTGAMGKLDFSKRKMKRERTLLSKINNALVSQVIDGSEHGYSEVKAFDNNAAKRVHNKPPKEGINPPQEPKPDSNRHPMEFMQMGGRGDQLLFGHDTNTQGATSKGKRK